MCVAWQFRDTNRESYCRTRHIQFNRPMYRRTVNKTTWSNPRYNTELVYFSVWVFETPYELVSFNHQRACEREYSRSIFNATRAGNGFKKIMRTGHGFNKGLWLGSRKGKYSNMRLVETWCLQHVRFATQKRETSGLINHQVKYFAKANSAFTLFLHRRHGRFIVYQFKTVSLLSNQDSKVTKRIPSSSSSPSSVSSPSSTTRLD